jgi:hypothetical protein
MKNINWNTSSHGHVVFEAYDNPNSLISRALMSLYEADIDERNTGEACLNASYDYRHAVKRVIIVSSHEDDDVNIRFDVYSDGKHLETTFLNAEVYSCQLVMDKSALPKTVDIILECLKVDEIKSVWLWLVERAGYNVANSIEDGYFDANQFTPDELRGAKMLHRNHYANPSNYFTVDRSSLFSKMPLEKH